MTDPVLVVDFDLQPQGDELFVRVTVHNRGPQDLANWRLKFDLPKSIQPQVGTTLCAHVGSHVTLAPTDERTLPSGANTSLLFSGAVGMIQRLSDLPRGPYLSYAQQDGTVVHLPAIVGEHNLESIATGRMIPQAYGGVTVVPAAASSRSEKSPPSASSDVGGIVPRPSHMRLQDGAFSTSEVIDFCGCESAAAACAWLADVLPIRMNESGKDEAALCFEMGPDIPTEGYGLHIGPDRICVTASDAAGFFNGAASLLQLNEVTDTAQVSWPCVEIDDWPRFNFRGLMLDCARHFHEKDTILRTLDLMARYKLNHFHWHLTDDEGWRLEIQAFPELTRRGAWRGEGEVLEPQFGTGPDRYGGFYSRQDVRDVVEYAAARQIVVIPEIDIPGHSRAAIKSYPELLVESEDSSVYCGAQLYTDNVLNPALPGTYQFLHTVLDEVCEMFPGPFVHLGADEVPEGVWIESPACQEFLQQHHYNSAHELQGHLLRDLQSYLAKRGKQLMGWEEAVHGDRLDYTATVNAWSGVPVGTELANTGYAVVACAAPFAYLDLAWDDNTFEPGYYWAGTCDLPGTYGYEPTTADLTEAGAFRFIGVQAVLWSELVRTPEELQYMLFPRLLALAETAWTAPSNKDWDDFCRRLPEQLAQLEQLGVNHRLIED